MTHRKTLVAAGLICATLGLHGLAHASPLTSRVHGLILTLSQTPPQGWAEDQPISLLVGIGPSDPRSRTVADSRPLRDASRAPETVTGWTKPLGLRFAIRW